MKHINKINLFFDASKKACKEALKLLTSPLDNKNFEGKTIGEGGDLTLLIDEKVEKIFFNYFKRFAAIYSEEYGYYGEGDYKIILDPIDGSDNFVSNFPYYGSSMALQYKDKTIAALICNFSNSEIFYKLGLESAKRGFLHHEKIRNLKKNQYSKIGIFEKSSLFPKIIDKLIEKKLKFRSPGAVALSLAYSFDAKYMIFLGKKRVFDLQAGLYITRDLYQYEDEKIVLIAQNENILKKIKAIILGENIWD